MNMLTERQWEMLEDANQLKGASLHNNMNTMSALYCRSLVEVNAKRRLKPTTLGQAYLRRREAFDDAPIFFEARREMRDMRRDVGDTPKL